MDKNRNGYIIEQIKLAPVTEKSRGNRLTWYGHGHIKR